MLIPAVYYAPSHGDYVYLFIFFFLVPTTSRLCIILKTITCLYNGNVERIMYVHACISRSAMCVCTVLSGTFNRYSTGIRTIEPSANAARETSWMILRATRKNVAEVVAMEELVRASPSNYNILLLALEPPNSSEINKTGNNKTI